MKKISQKANMGENVSIGEFVVIKNDVEIGNSVVIGNNVVIYEGTKIGNNIRIDDNTVIGKQPMRAINSIFKDKDKRLPAVIGNGCIIGTGVVLYAGCEVGEKVLIADLATVREDASIGDKTIIGRNVSIENCCKVGSNCKIQTNAYVTAYSDIGDFVFIAPGVVTTNDNFAGRSKERFKCYKGVIVKKGGRIAANATIMSGKIINEDTLVAAGSVVTKDTLPRKIVMGAPAREHKDVPKDQLLENQ